MITVLAFKFVYLLSLRTSKSVSVLARTQIYQTKQTEIMKIILFDVCLLYRQINNQNDHTTLQNDQKNLEKWASDWGMRFNAKKCYILSMKKKSNHPYTLNNQILEQVPSNPYLGLQIAEDFKWKEHINNTCKKASSTLGFLRRNLQHCRDQRMQKNCIYCSRKINYGIWISHMGSIYKTGNKTGEYSKKGSQVHNQRLQKQGRRMHH